MVLPRGRFFLGRVDTATPRFDSLLRRATSRERLAPLIRALGFEPRLGRGSGAVPNGFGLNGAESVRDVVAAGDRGGLTLLLVETATEPEPEGVSRMARRVRSHNPARPALLLVAGPRYRSLVFASFGLEGDVRQLAVERRSPRRSDVEALEEMAARDGEAGVALALRHARALDRSRLTRHFFRDFKAQRARIAAAWRGLAAGLTAERDQLGLLLLCRLMFLYFLQRRGHLAGDERYLPRLLERWRRRGPGEPPRSFFRVVLQPLFFGALNTRPEFRAEDARALGDLPYLNGGLFERHAYERRFPELDLEDDIVAGAFDGLLERYRFTTLEASEAEAGAAGDVGVDPEMLGRVFEGLMAPERRGATGTFFTPARVVDRLVREGIAARLVGVAGLDAREADALVRAAGVELEPRRRSLVAEELSRLLVLDPACGSGAFLLGALARMARLRAALDGGDAARIRREIVGRALHGVDVQEDAALLCSLRLWLALAADEVAPLPNLDRRIRQGDALVDPLDVAAETDGAAAAWRGAGADAEVRRALRTLGPLGSEYLSADPERRPALQAALRREESALARAWLAALDLRLRTRLAEATATAAARDLFGERPREAERAEAERVPLEARRAELHQLRAALDDTGSLPFFSFGVHFPEAATRGFDLILSNPPWVRAHRWPASVSRLVRQRYAVCRRAGWRRGAALGGALAGSAAQVDLSLLFVERAVGLLSPGGVVAMLLPAKVMRSLYGSGARSLFLTETRLVALEDHSLDQRSIFRADAFTAAVVARRSAGGEARRTGDSVRITMTGRGAEPLRFLASVNELPVVPGDLEAPWLLAPPAACEALRRMQAAGPPLGTHPGLRVRRGVLTGANDVLLVREAKVKLGDLAWIRAEGFFRSRRESRPAGEARRFQGYVEASTLRSLVRGSGIAAWRYRAAGHVLWTHDPVSAAPREPPPRLTRYLSRHTAALRARSGWRPGLPLGALFRVTPYTAGPKVAWHDLAETLNAVAIPGSARGPDGREGPVIPLNTVYFIPAPGESQAHVLAALFNSLPVRTFARAVAERAKDARFRFFAWTIALLPLPEDWMHGRIAARLGAISESAHGRGGLEPAGQAELDALVGELYGLNSEQTAALSAFDAWLRGESGSCGPCAAEGP